VTSVFRSPPPCRPHVSSLEMMPNCLPPSTSKVLFRISLPVKECWTLCLPHDRRLQTSISSVPIVTRFFVRSLLGTQGVCLSFSNSHSIVSQQFFSFRPPVFASRDSLAFPPGGIGELLVARISVFRPVSFSQSHLYHSFYPQPIATNMRLQA